VADLTTPGHDDQSVSTAGSEFTLSRWSRLKSRATSDKSNLSTNATNDDQALNDGGVTINAEFTENVTMPRASIAANVNANPHDAASPQSELPSLADVSLEKDFTPFMQAKVPELLRRQALKALFKESHFNTMDGLDTYIDDYTQFEPISPEDLEKLSAWQSIKNPLQQVVTPGG
jgi:hypothetical protein